MPKGTLGYNARIAGKSIGARSVRVMEINFGLEIIASADSEARSRRAFYPVSAEGSAFSVTLGFTSWEERERINTWLSNFMGAVGRGSTKYGTLTVQVPGRNFFRVGVPQGPLVFGEGILDVAYQTAINFVWSADVVDNSLSDKQSGASYFKGPGKNTTARFFYPKGVQAKGAEALDGATFDSDPVLVTPLADQMPEIHGVEDVIF